MLSKETVQESVRSVIANNSDLDMRQFNECVANHSTAEEIESDEALAGQLGVQATPTLFINGRLLKGFHTADQILQAVGEAEIQAERDSAASKSQQCTPDSKAGPKEASEAESKKQWKCGTLNVENLRTAVSR